jgi:hypothetical protein
MQIRILFTIIAFFKFTTYFGTPCMPITDSTLKEIESKSYHFQAYRKYHQIGKGRVFLPFSSFLKEDNTSSHTYFIENQFIFHVFMYSCIQET